MFELNINITREKGNSIQDTISDPVFTGKGIDVVCYDESSEDEVIEAVMYIIDDSEFIDNLLDNGHKSILVNGKEWSLTLCEFR